MAKTFRAALFDLDGVVFDTEKQYTVFWGMIGREYYPQMADFAQQIKGQTLVQIYDRFFSRPEMLDGCGNMADCKAEQERITQRLDDFERQMTFEYVEGFEQFVADLKAHGVRCAVVTSSNRQKMNCVYESHPEFRQLFDRILTSEDFSKSKPDPDCYLRGAAAFGLTPDECVGFEDSFNGLRAIRAAGEFAIGLATTNPVEAIRPLSDYVIDNYKGLSYEAVVSMLEQQ